MPKLSKTTQGFVPIKDIRDGVVILKNGSLRMILMVSSINFALKSDDEQVAILMQFQNFLNSLDFSVQMTIHSMRLDINPYLTMLSKRLDKQDNELIKIQTREYVRFIKTFTASVNIMSKNFFVVVPYTTGVIKTSGGFIDRLFKTKQEKTAKKERFDESKIQLEQRATIVEQGLTGAGVRTARLGTEELIELYYKIFNPGEKDKPPTLESVAE